MSIFSYNKPHFFIFISLSCKFFQSPSKIFANFITKIFIFNQRYQDFSNTNTLSSQTLALSFRTVAPIICKICDPIVFSLLRKSSFESIWWLELVDWSTLVQLEEVIQICQFSETFMVLKHSFNLIIKSIQKFALMNPSNFC